MAMTKKERAEVDDLRRELALHKALGWPQYPEPVPIDAEEATKNLGWGKLIVAWWFNSYSHTVGQGCFDRIGHSKHSTDKTNSRDTGGPWYTSKRDALAALRWAATREAAKELARVDALVEAGE